MAISTPEQLDADRRDKLTRMFPDLLQNCLSEVEAVLREEFVDQLKDAPGTAQVDLRNVDGFRALPYGAQQGIADLVKREYEKDWQVISVCGYDLSFCRKPLT